MALQIEEITELFHAQGAAQYGAEAINQQQHALQCAHLAEQAGASPELVAAALLHDLGHMLAPKSSSPSGAVDDVHQYVAIPFLRGLFPAAVIEPIRLHVDAKRYLCQADPGYWASLPAQPGIAGRTIFRGRGSLFHCSGFRHGRGGTAPLG